MAPNLPPVVHGRRVARLASLVLAAAVFLVLTGPVARGQTPAPASPPGTGGTTFGAVRVLGGNDLPRNSGQENQPPVWITIDSKGSSAVVTIGNATRSPLDFSGTVVMSLGTGARASGVLVTVGSAVIEGNQVVWNGFSLAATQIVPAIVTLAADGGASAPPPGATAISEVSIDAKAPGSGGSVNERVAGGGPSVTALAAAPPLTGVNSSTRPAAAPAVSAVAGSATPLSANTARAFGAVAVAVLMAGLVLVALLVYASGRRLERQMQEISRAAPESAAAASGSNGFDVIGGATDAVRLQHIEGKSSLQARHAAQVIVQDGADAGRRWPITSAEITIGRNTVSDIVLDDRTVSDRHAVVTRQADETYQLSDSGSTNGTYLNGLRLTEPATLRAGDALKIGATTFLFLDEVPEPV